MVFSSTIFLFGFLPFTLTGYYLIRKDLRNAFLLFMSLAFYAYGEPKFVFVMIASILVNYIMGLFIDKTRDSKLLLKRIVLIIATGANLSLLFYYKYFDFFISNVNNVFRSDFALRNIILPIGISFFTFQGMSYIFDLYLGKFKVQKNPINIALYIALFPQLIAGPIVRYIDVNEQILQRTYSVDKFADGIKRFTVGLSKKIIISNMFAVVADNAFNTIDIERSVTLAWLGIIAYTIQIYFDFSGYSDMAIGLGKMFGFDFLENFNYPYISKNISEFWRRWHISLSTWFKDYIYIPLGGNRKGNVYVNLLIVFFVTGLWHGASWNFIIWGLWHGMFLIIERIGKTRKVNKKYHLPDAVKWIYTMLVVMIGWVLFRAVDLTSAWNYIKTMFGLFGNELYCSQTILFAKEYMVIFIIAVLCSMPLGQYVKKLYNKSSVINRIETLCSSILFAVLLLIAISFTVTSTYNPFIYFNF